MPTTTQTQDQIDAERYRTAVALGLLSPNEQEFIDLKRTFQMDNAVPNTTATQADAAAPVFCKDCAHFKIDGIFAYCHAPQVRSTDLVHAARPRCKDMRENDQCGRSGLLFTAASDIPAHTPQ